MKKSAVKVNHKTWGFAVRYCGDKANAVGWFLQPHEELGDSPLNLLRQGREVDVLNWLWDQLGRPQV